jgi:thioesterase domain-containing protein
VREGAAGNSWLVGYVVFRSGQAPKADELRRWLRPQLPEHMVPSLFVSLEALPRTPNGKVARRLLPPPGDERPDLNQEFVGPRTPLEETLARIWAGVLGLKRVGIHDNFFDLGGHSLIAVKLFSRIKRTLGHELPLATLIQSPTIAHLAEVLEQDDWQPPWSALVALQPRGARLPFFCLHGVGGEVLCYRALSRHLGEEQPFYSFQAPAATGRQLAPWGIPELAACYVRELRQVQPHGPYALGGLSFGGIVAFEMAQQLLAQGESVTLLALLDAGCPGHVVKLRPLQRVWEHGCNLARLRPRQWPTYLAEKGRALGVRLRRGFWRLAHWLSARFGTPVTPEQLPRDVAGLLAISSYMAQPYPGPITLFRAAERLGGHSRDPFMGWDQVARGGLVVHEVPGDHGTLINEPHVRVLAQRLGACLDAVEATHPPGFAARHRRSSGPE